MSKILIVDCFDSFTYNLFHYLDELNEGSCRVIRYDSFQPEDAAEYDRVVLSPGPGLPKDYPGIFRFLELRRPSQPLLGVCLGHQCIGVHYGGRLRQLDKVLHGVESVLKIDSSSALFRSIENNCTIGHYHSWVIDEDAIPGALKVSSHSSEGWVMSLEHRTDPVYGLQFHPESIMTREGKKILNNWLKA